MDQHQQKLLLELETKLASEKPGLWSQQLMMPEGRISNPTQQMAPINSAVLICLYYANNEICFPIIRRPQYNGPHSGQMAFPGGKYEPFDGTLINTALREANEEVGIIPEQVKILGTLSPLLIPVTNIQVLPVVGYINHPPKFSTNDKEVDALFIVQLNQLVDSKNKRTEQWDLYGRQVNVPFYFLHEQKIWGATAMMLSEFEQIIKPYYHRSI